MRKDGTNKSLYTGKASISRREFIEKAASGYLSIALFPYLPYERLGKFRECAEVHASTKFHAESDEAIEYIRKHLVPIGPESKAQIERIPSHVKERFEFRIRKKVDELGYGKNKYSIKITDKSFGVPNREEHKKPIERYCRQAYDFLVNHPQFSGRFEDFNIEWISFSYGENYEKNFNHKGFIGNKKLGILHLTAINETDKSQKIDLYRAYSNPGGVVEIFDHDEKFNPVSWYVFIGSVELKHVLLGPFSEILPLLVESHTRTYEKKAGILSARQAVEALSEGASHVLALEFSPFAEKLGFPKPDKAIKESLDSFDKKLEYRYVRNTVNLIHSLGKDGIRKAFELYEESPAKFMEAVKKYRK